MDIKEEETIFNWFIANKCSSSNGGKGTKPKINKTLCKATENDLTLPYYKEIDNSKKVNINKLGAKPRRRQDA